MLAVTTFYLYHKEAIFWRKRIFTFCPLLMWSTNYLCCSTWQHVGFVLYCIVLFCLKYCCNRVKVCMYILIYTYQWLLELKIIVMGVFRGLINENKTWADWHSLLWTTLCLWLALTYCHNISLHIQNWGQALLGPCIAKGKGAVA